MKKFILRMINIYLIKCTNALNCEKFKIKTSTSWAAPHFPHDSGSSEQTWSPLRENANDTPFGPDGSPKARDMIKTKSLNLNSKIL